MDIWPHDWYSTMLHDEVRAPGFGTSRTGGTWSLRTAAAGVIFVILQCALTFPVHWAPPLEGTQNSAPSPGAAAGAQLTSRPGGGSTESVRGVAALFPGDNPGSVTRHHGLAVPAEVGRTSGRGGSANEAASEARFNVTFAESGLPIGSLWNVTLNGQTVGAMAPSSVNFSEVNGTYPYVTAGPLGWDSTGSRSNGTVRVAGAPDAVVVGGIGVGSGPQGIAYDPANGYLYVANGFQANVTVIDGSTDTVVVPSIGAGTFAYGVAFDASNGYVYVTNGNAGTGYGSNNVTVIDGATNQVVPPGIGAGTCPQGIAYDSSNGYLYVTNFESNNVTVINGSSNQVVVPSIGVGSRPIGIAYDDANGFLYVTNYLSNNVTVINGATNTVVAPSIGVGSNPNGVTYDPQNGYLYVANMGLANVSVINGATDTVVVSSIGVGSYPFGSAYDPSSGYLYVLNSGSDNVTVIDGTTGTVVVGSIGVGTYPYGGAYDPSNGFVYVANPFSNNVTVINGNGIVQTYWVVGARYAVALTETGLPLGTVWSATLGGSAESSTQPTLAFSEPNGSFPFTISGIAGWSATTYGGTLRVAGSPTGLVIAWSPAAYPVTFSHTGLPAGTNWSVSLAGVLMFSTGEAISFTEPNGSYLFKPGPVPGWTTLFSGQTIVVNGSAVNETVAWSQIVYPVTFTESGLPSGTPWSVRLNGTVETSGTGSIAFREPNGTYPYAVEHVLDYQVSTDPSSPLVVHGSSLALAADFLHAFDVNFSIGSDVTGTCQPPTENLALTAEVDGGMGPYNYTWAFGAGSPLSYGASVVHTFGPNGGNLTLWVVDSFGDNESVSRSVGGSAVPGCPIPVSGSTPDTDLAILAIFAIVVVALAVVALEGVRRSKPPESSPPPPGEG